MPSVTIDAGVLAPPPVTAPPGQVHSYVETLLDWSRLLDEPWIAVYMSERASEALFEDKLYPLYDSLRTLFDAHGVVEYDVNTVVRVANALLELTPSFETYFKARDVLASDIATEPDLLSIHTSSGLVADLMRCVVLLAVLRSHCRNPVVDHALVVQPWNGAAVVKVRALIHDIEHSREDMDEVPLCPDYFSGTVLACQSFKEFVLSLDERAVWEAAHDQVGLKTALQIALYRARVGRGENVEWDGLQGFRFGRNFYETARECCSAQGRSFTSRLLRAMIETVDRLHVADTHPLRAGKGGNDPQVVRGKDTAWRRDVDDEYHVHYWECEDGDIEFASVNPHNVFLIPR